MPNFNKKEQELLNRLDKWLYFIKHLEDFQSIPAIFKDDIFISAFEKAAIANLNEDERHEYEQSLKIFRDNKAVFDFAVENAFDGGKLEGIKKVGKKLKEKGMDIDFIIDATGLTKDEIDAL